MIKKANGNVEIEFEVAMSYLIDYLKTEANKKLAGQWTYNQETEELDGYQVEQLSIKIIDLPEY